jgi:hypothetical protein
MLLDPSPSYLSQLFDATPLLLYPLLARMRVPLEIREGRNLPCSLLGSTQASLLPNGTFRLMLL